jgi:hypothetical protein
MWWAREVAGGKITLKEDALHYWNGRRIDCLIPLFIDDPDQSVTSNLLTETSPKPTNQPP